MPKIQVNERDMSWYYKTRVQGPLVVLMPGMSNWGPAEPILVTEDNYASVIGDAPVRDEDFSYHMALSFLKTGINVLFWRVNLYDGTTGTGKASRKWYGADTDGKIINGSDGNPCFLIEAKYAGTMGNRLSVEIYGSGATRTVRVYKKDPGSSMTSQLVENLIYNFDDIYSPYYYTNVNNDSKFVEVTPQDIDDFSVIGPLNKGLMDADGNVMKFYLENGNDGRIADTTDGYRVIPKVIELIQNSTEVIDNLNDPLIYQYDVIVDGGYNDYPVGAMSDIDKFWVRLAKSRGTAVYLVSGSENFDAAEFYNYCGLPKDGGSSSGSEPSYAYSETDSFNTSYAAAYGPWCMSVLVSNGAVRSMPGYYAFLIAWGNALNKGIPMWDAPAGVKRTNLDGIVKGTSYLVGSSVIDMWQNQNFISNQNYSEIAAGVYCVNPIAHLRGYGYTVYGNSTLLKNRYDGATSMLQMFSVRILCNLIKLRAYETSLYLQFDRINSEVFGEFKVLMTTYMDRLKYGGALYDYKIIADRSKMTLDDINSRTIPITIKISPTPTAENFIINLEINQAGVSFGSDDVETSVTNEIV